jgi:hypothetical protein
MTPSKTRDLALYAANAQNKLTNISKESDQSGVLDGNIVSVGAPDIHGFGKRKRLNSVPNNMSLMEYWESLRAKYLMIKYTLPTRIPNVHSGKIRIIRSFTKSWNNIEESLS